MIDIINYKNKAALRKMYRLLEIIEELKPIIEMNRLYSIGEYYGGQLIKVDVFLVSKKRK